MSGSLRSLEHLRVASGSIRARPCGCSPRCRSRRLVRESHGGWLLGAHAFELGSSFVRGNSIWSRGSALVERLGCSSPRRPRHWASSSTARCSISLSRTDRANSGSNPRPGTRHPAHATALGKVLLAAMPWTEAEVLLGPGPLVRLTPNTLTTIPALRARAQDSRRERLCDRRGGARSRCDVHRGADQGSQRPCRGCHLAFRAHLPESREERSDRLRRLVTSHAADASDQLGAKACRCGTRGGVAMSVGPPWSQSLSVPPRTPERVQRVVDHRPDPATCHL